MGSSDYSTVGRSAGLMTILTIVSRVTGFIRTWAMAAAIGMSLLSSSYQVANNLPNMLLYSANSGRRTRSSGVRDFRKSAS